MFRFGLIILSLIAFCYIFIPRSDPDARKLTVAAPKAVANDKAVLVKLENTPATNTVMSDIAPPAKPEAPKLEIPTVTASVTPAPVQATVQIENRTATAATLATPAASPAKVEAVDPALAMISDADLPLVTQRELTKLGCYESKIDGVWGQKSRAAVAEFNKRVTGSWDGEPNRALIGALRSAPAGLCKQSCADGAAGGKCIAASPKSKTAADSPADREPSYLPPWMRGQQAASTEPDTVTVQAGGTTTAGSTVTPPDRDTLGATSQRRSEGSGERRSYERRRDWSPEGWPRSSR